MSRLVRHICLPVLLFALPAAARAAEPLHFENDILPILARYGCSSSGCHGKAEGQGGFKLSVFSSDPEADYAALFARPIPGAAIEILSWSVQVTTAAARPQRVAPVEPRPAPGPDGTRAIHDGRAGRCIEVPLFRREAMLPGTTITGPALIAEDATSTFVAASFDAQIDGAGCIVMTRKAA